MGGANQTSTNEFLIVGFSDMPQLQIPLFVALLMIFLATIMGNLLIMIIVYTCKQLHTPMYFFLTNLSFLDITYTAIIFPKMLLYFFQDGMHISLSKFLVQIYFFIALVITELFLLTVMAFDRYVAICNPLRYTVIMNKAVCLRLAVVTWSFGFVDALPHTIQASGLSFCGSRIINHFFCDVTALMKLSCSSTSTMEATSYFFGIVVAVVPFFVILTSYICFISAILRIPSTQGRCNAFSTCSSHLIVVVLFYGSLCYTYVRPTSTYSVRDSKLTSLAYITTTPLFNPLIYSLKNTEFKRALEKIKLHQKQ